MRKVLFVVAVLILARSPAQEFAGAQTKKGAEPAGVIEIGEGKDGKFRFTIRDDEGKFIAQSGPVGFATFKDAEAEVTRLKAILAKAKVVMKEAAKDKDKTKDK